MKHTILLFTDWYEPGYKAGGPIRSAVNFVQQMKDNYVIMVFTADRDLNDSIGYPGIVTNKWVEKEGVFVYYCTPDKLSWRNVNQQIKSINPTFIYLNSMFSLCFTVFPLMQSVIRIAGSKIILAPRGMLKASALSFKPYKKEIFLFLFKFFGFHKTIHWHATDLDEAKDIKKRFGENIRVSQLPNFGQEVTYYPGPIQKVPGVLKMIFIGRLHPIKNLDFLLELLDTIKGEITLTIIGNEANKSFVQKCKEAAVRLPKTVTVDFKGEIPNEQLGPILATHHIFALPTKGENFGHAIFEALRAGKPVLISDQTPWRNLEASKAGWDLPLSNKKAFIDAIQQAISFDKHEYGQWSKAAWQLAFESGKQFDLKTAYHKLFS